jgi:eukaryotic-like serine/threonine-protein kinase
MPEAPATVGRYHIERLIAHGGMGSLYLARDPAIDRLVAIKLLKEGFDDAAARERFAREARSTGRLHHPNIVTVFDVGEHDDRPFIAMEYVSGETLAQLIRRRALGRLWMKLAILEDICAALHYAHTAAIVHRDIKPANVMLDESGLVKILDFGIAHVAGINITRAGDVVGTLNYMSPEQLAGEDVDHRTDIYSVGALAYELVTHQMAFPGTIQTGILHQILNSSPPAIPVLVPGIDPEIPAMIDRAMAKAPEARYQDLESLRQDLVAVRTRLLEAASAGEDADPDAETRVHSEAVGSGTQPRSSPRVRSTLPSSARGIAVRSAMQEARPPRRTGPIVAGIAVAALAVIVAAIWTINQSPSGDPPIEAQTTAERPQPPVPPSVIPPPSSAAPAAEPPADVSRAELEEQLRAVRVTARQQIAAGDRQGALETLSRGLALDAGDPEVSGLLDDLARVARRAASEAGAAAATRGQRSHTAFRDAQAREREADSLLRAGDRVPAIRGFWAATSRYSQVPEVSGQQPASAPPQAAPADPVVIPVEPPAAVPSSPSMVTTPPSASKPVPAPAEKPATPPPAAPKPEASRDPAPDPNAAHLVAIRDTLRQYTQAYQNLDSPAVGRLMPSLTPDQLRNLERDFSNYRSYTVEIRDERIAVEGTTATVACQVVRSFETRSGVTGSHTADSIFHLRRIGSGWTIERVESQ